MRHLPLRSGFFQRRGLRLRTRKLVDKTDVAFRNFAKHSDADTDAILVAI
jgi:hypothetical protein